nr:hypothetical protein [Tanacetum cinerariifolium]
NVTACARCVTTKTELKTEFFDNECYDMLLHKYHTLEKHCITLEVNNQLNTELFQRDTWSSQESALTFAELFEINNLKAQAQAKDTVTKLATKNDHLKQSYKQLYDSIKSLRVRSKEQCGDLINKVNLKSAEVSDLNARLQEKVLVITALKEQLDKLKGNAVLTEAISLNPIDPKLLKVDVTPVVPKLRKNRMAHIDYIRHTQGEAATLRKIVERVNLVSSASGSMSQDNTKNNRIRQTQKKAKKNKVEDHLRTVTSSLNKASVVDSKATSSVLNSVSNLNSDLKCASSNGCLLSDNHDTCVGKVFKTVGHIWKPTGRTFTLVRNVCPLTRIATPTIVPPREPIPIVNKIDKIFVTLYLDSGCSKHMTGDRSQLVNFVQKFLGTVKFGNDHMAKIMGYGDYQIGTVTISRVYYVEGLGHNLFSVGQFCDSDLEGNNLYTLSIQDMMASSPICLLSKASKTKLWLWHRRLSHLNFGAINHLARQGLVRGLLKLKFEKDHLCSAFAMGQSTRKTHKPKSEDTNQEKLYLLHMDLCEPMCVESVNEKKKTPYELLHNKLPDLSFFHVFGALCYPTNDSVNLEKLQPKADIEIFIGYAPTKKAF